ncbi:MAG TPA: carboxypeptidase M32, partial [Pirellulales bacterium]
LHQRITDKAYGEKLAALAESDLCRDPHSDAGANVRQLKRQFDKKTKLPEDLVKEQARLSILGQQAWVDARKNNDFPAFQPLLEQIVKLKREEAAALGFPEVPYDALLDDFEPEEKTSNVARVLAGLRKELVPLVAELVDSGKRPDNSILKRTFPIEAQKAFGREAAQRVGFDFSRGRLDVSAHPFCGGSGPHDIRMTTRYSESFFSESFFGTLHETGHGLYEQGLIAENFGVPLGEAISLGIHESQSRMWENLVGRSRPFWEFHFPLAQKAFPSALGDVSLDAFYAAINDVAPTLIRVEADECTYNLHILIRFELEQALVHDELQVADLPGAWNEKYKSFLGIIPPTDALGVLQDIHWSGGAIGYFSTYSLGNLYAAQLFDQAEKDLGDLATAFAYGEYHALLDWLRDKIHRHGRRYTAAELVKNVTGKPLSHEALMTDLKNKFRPLFGLA